MSPLPIDSLSLPEPVEGEVIKTPQQVLEELKQLKYNNYLINFESRVKMWQSAHSDANGDCPALPLHWDTEYQDWVWLNREQRRQR